MLCVENMQLPLPTFNGERAPTSCRPTDLRRTSGIHDVEKSRCRPSMVAMTGTLWRWRDVSYSWSEERVPMRGRRRR